MSEKDEAFKENFKEFVREYILEKGDLVSENPSYYGWGAYDPDFYKHTRKFTAETTIRESVVHEFQGTFYEGDDSRIYLDAVGITCECGKYEGRTIRVDNNISDMLGGLFG